MIELVNANDFKNVITVAITKEEKEGYVLNKYKNVNRFPKRENRKSKRLAPIGC